MDNTTIVNGMPIEEYLSQQFGVEIHDNYKDEITNISKIIKIPKPKMKLVGNVVTNSGFVKTYTQQDIRRYQFMTTLDQYNVKEIEKFPATIIVVRFLREWSYIRPMLAKIDPKYDKDYVTCQAMSHWFKTRYKAVDAKKWKGTTIASVMTGIYEIFGPLGLLIRNEAKDPYKYMCYNISPRFNEISFSDLLYLLYGNIRNRTYADPNVGNLTQSELKQKQDNDVKSTDISDLEEIREKLTVKKSVKMSKQPQRPPISAIPPHPKDSKIDEEDITVAPATAATTGKRYSGSVKIFGTVIEFNIKVNDEK